MDIHNIIGARQLSLAATAALALGLATAAAPADAATPARASASVAHDTLTVRGTSHADTITVGVAAGDVNKLVVDFGTAAPARSFDRATFSAITVFLGSGDDQFHVAQDNGVFDEALAVYGGSGNDTLVGGSGNDRLSGGSGDDNIQGGDGNDLIFGDSGKDFVDGNRGTDTEILGSGAVTALWNPGEGNDIIDGQSGHDTLVFNGSAGNEVMSASANGTHVVFLRDLGGIRMDLDGVEQLNVAALGGADSVTVNDLSGTDLRQANVDLSVRGAGDGQADVVTVNGTDRADRINVAAYGPTVRVAGLHTATTISGSESMDRLQVNSLGGNDSVRVSDGARARIGVGVDLGTGQR